MTKLILIGLDIKKIWLKSTIIAILSFYPPTDAVGCRDCVDEGINGLKVSVYSSRELAMAIEKLILNQAILIKMGLNSRKKAEKEYDVNNVVSKHLKIYDY